MQYGLDMLNPPRGAEAAAFRDLGWSWLGCYIGGPYLSGHRPWSRLALNSLAEMGFAFLPIYVGQQLTAGMHGVLTYDQGLVDGNDAKYLLAQKQLPEGCIVALDLEAGNPLDQAEQYVRGFVEVANAAAHPVVLYCEPRAAEVLGRPELVDFTWVAKWVAKHVHAAPTGSYDPSEPPAWDAWQFGTGEIFGVNVDYNSASDGFPLVRL